MKQIIKQFGLVLSCFCGFSALSSHVYAQDSAVEKAKLILFPALTRSVETSWAAGGAASLTFRGRGSDSLSRTSGLQAAVLYSLRRQLIATMRGTQYLQGERYIFNELFSFSSFPDKFWGMGKDTKDNAFEDYQFRQFYVFLHPMHRVARHLFVGLRYEYQRVWNIQYQAGGLFDQQNVAGRKGYHVSGPGISLTYDTRNHAFSPDKGFFAQVYLSRFGSFSGSDYDYTNYALDLRHFMKAGDQGVIALQAWVFANRGDVPLRSLAAFGGGSSMRGYYEGRFRDLNQYVIQGEYRRPVYKRFGLVAFASFGNVASRLGALDLTNLKYSFGGGMRYALNKSEKLNLRIDYGIGRGHNSGLYFQLGEAF